MYIHIFIYLKQYCWPHKAAVATPTATLSLFKKLIESWSPVSAVYDISHMQLCQNRKCAAIPGH